MDNTTVLFTNDESTNDWDLTISKIITGTCLFVISVICGIVPFKLAQIFKWNEPIDKHDKESDRKSSMVVSILLCFGGGVLLATTFLHLLPEISQTIALLENDGLIPKSSFHLAEILMMTGFFLIYMIEELVHNYLHRHQHKKSKKAEAEMLEKNASNNTLDHRASIAEFGEAFMRGIQARNSTIVNKFVENDQRTPQNSVTDLIAANELNGVNVDGHNHGSSNHIGHGHSHLPLPLPHSDEEDMLVSSLRGLLIVLALSIHELFEGFAVGLEKTTAGVYFMFAAVSAHKFVIAFTIGVELMVQRTKLWLAFTYVVVYSIVSAIGIAIGALLTAGSNADNLQVPNVILQGLATGTLLYVIFFEVLSKDRSGLLPYLSVLGGFLLMFGLQYIAGITESQAWEMKSLVDNEATHEMLNNHHHG